MDKGTEPGGTPPPKPDESHPQDAEPEPDTVLLQDLAPRKDVKGGSGKLRFGELGSIDDRTDA